ncbi:hypothetical protein ON010_g16818 [Phytophthora cinnamomi]|nr:hypothetical protein ON010_g16818 [Phytophthora cinnamomi]
MSDPARKINPTSNCDELATAAGRGEVAATIAGRGEVAETAGRNEVSAGDGRVGLGAGVGPAGLVGGVGRKELAAVVACTEPRSRRTTAVCEIQLSATAASGDMRLNAQTVCLAVGTQSSRQRNATTTYLIPNVDNPAVKAFKSMMKDAIKEDEREVIRSLEELCSVTGYANT